MREVLRFVGLIVLVAVSGAAARADSDRETLERLFAERFHTHYEELRCGLNILGLVNAAREAGVDLSGARILSITNSGFSALGQVNAELARGRNGNPPNERNWEAQHVILEWGCLVFDFDFMNAPTVLPMDEYFERMFLDERRPAAYGGFHVGRDRKLDEYRVAVEKEGSPAPKVTLRSFLAAGCQAR